MYGHHVQQTEHARVQLKDGNYVSLSPFAPENLVSQDRLGRPMLSTILSIVLMVVFERYQVQEGIT